MSFAYLGFDGPTPFIKRTILFPFGDFSDAGVAVCLWVCARVDGLYDAYNWIGIVH